MKKSLAAALPLMLLLSVTGCRHRAKVVSVPLPPPPPRRHVHRHPAVLPQPTVSDLPVIPVTPPPSVMLGGAVETASPKRESHRQPDEAAQDAKSTQVDANKSATAGEEPPATTPIGQLSAAPSTQDLPSKSSIVQQIASIQKQLGNIHRALSEPEQKTASQIRTFLAKATNALQAGDLDGAHTLTVKASVLLAELK